VTHPTESDAGRRLRVLVLGSTGSIGTQALEVIAANPDRFEVVGLAAGGANLDTLLRQRAETGVTNIAIADERAAQLAGHFLKEEVPFADLKPPPPGRADRRRRRPQCAGRRVGPATDTGCVADRARLALANKESLIGGPLVLAAARPGQIVPVDSEHSALAQCLRGGDPDEVAKLVLTASGGPFRGWAAADLESVTRSRPAPTRPGPWAR